MAAGLLLKEKIDPNFYYITLQYLKNGIDV